MQLAEYFSRFGEVVEAKVVYSHENMKSRGFGFVIFRGEEAVDAVLQDYNSHYLHGRWIECKPAMLKDELAQQPSGEPAPVNSKHAKSPADGLAANCKKNRRTKSNNKLQQKHPDSPPTKILTQQHTTSKTSRLPKEIGHSSPKLAGLAGGASLPSDALRSSGSKHLQSANTSSHYKIEDPSHPSDSKENKNVAASGKRKPASNKNKPSKRPVESAACEGDPFGQPPSRTLCQHAPAPRTFRAEADSGFGLASQFVQGEQTELGVEPFAREPLETMNTHAPLLSQQTAFANDAPSSYYPLPRYSYTPQRFLPFYPQLGPYAQARHPSSIQPLARIVDHRLYDQPHPDSARAPKRLISRYRGTPELDLDDQLMGFDPLAIPETHQPLDFHHPIPETAPAMSGLSRYGESSQRIRGFDSLHQSAYFPRNHLPIGFAAQDLRGADALHWYGRRWETGPSAFHQSSDIDALEQQDVYADPLDEWLGDETQDCQLQRGVRFQPAPDSRGISCFPNAQTDPHCSSEAQGVLSQEQWEDEPSSQKVSAVNPDECQFERKARLFNSRTRDESELMMPEKSKGCFKATGSKMEIM